MPSRARRLAGVSAQDESWEVQGDLLRVWFLPLETGEPRLEIGFG